MGALLKLVQERKKGNFFSVFVERKMSKEIAM